MALDDDIRRLSDIGLFKNLEPDALRLLAFSAETRLLRGGDVLFRAGEPTDCAYLLVNGAIDLETSDGETVEHLRSTALLGELALITQTHRPATAIARQPTTVMRISRVLFHRVLEEFPKSAIRVRSAVAQRLKDYSEALARFAEQD